MENWLVIEGFDGAYEVSDLGRLRRAMGPAGVGPRTEPGKILAARADVNGYPRVVLYNRLTKRFRSIGLHTAVLEAFVGMRPEGTEGSHLNGDRADARLANLCWESRSANHIRKRKHGTMMQGEKHYATTLTAAAVEEIRRRAGAETHQALANEFGVRRETVSRIIRRETWRELETAA